MHGDIYREFGNRLSELRKSKKMTQADVADKLNTVQSTYSGYELGTRKVTLDIIKTLADIFDVSPDYLILGKGSNCEMHNPGSDYSREAYEIAYAYDNACQKDKDTVRLILGMTEVVDSPRTDGEQEKELA